MGDQGLSRETHIIKLGTMGEYGTPNIDIEECIFEIEHNGRKDNFLFPRQGSSIYHTTKIMDTDLLGLVCAHGILGSLILCRDQFMDLRPMRLKLMIV